MEWLTTLIEKAADFLRVKLDFLAAGPAYSPAIYIAIFGIAAVLIAFFIALIAKNVSKTNKFRKNLEDAAAYINALGTVDEENVELLNTRLQSMPYSVTKGWGNFLDRQTGYPSDYITEKDVVGDRKANPRGKGGKTFFNLVSAIVIVLGAAAAAVGCREAFVNIAAEKVTLAVLSIAGAVAGPLLVYIILSAILAAGYGKQFKKMTAAFRTFQDALDNTVTIYREEQDEFVSENIEEINATIEEILANKLDDKEIIEIVTTPKVAEEAVAPKAEPVAAPIPAPVAAPAQEAKPAPVQEEKQAPAPEVKPVPAAVKEEVAAAVVKVEKTEEEKKGERLLQLVYIASKASKDKSLTPDQLVELAEILYEAKNSGDYNTPDEQEIFDSCLKILSQAYYG